ncbi:methylmalonyl-CoA mutase, partial [candidate division TA06 bacterium]
MNVKDKFGEWKEKADKKSTRDEDFTTVSGQPVDILYLPSSRAAYAQKLGVPGEYPYTRGIHPTMYRGRLWTMRLFSGLGSAEDTNQRYHFLLERGQTGLSGAFD